MKVLALCADVSGCLLYRYSVPFGELKRFGVDSTPIFTLPVNPYRPLFNELYELISEFDLVMVQRCPILSTVHTVRDVCDLLNKPLVFDTDDDYFNVPEHNPGYAAFGSKEQQDKYKELLKIMDMVTVSTNELKDLYYPYNKNIHVLPNNVKYIPSGYFSSPKRDIAELTMKDGKPDIFSRSGIICVPGYWKFKEEINRTVRIGYTVTANHKQDFETIKPALIKLFNKYHKKLWMVMIGDKYFFDCLAKDIKQLIHIPVTLHHEQYLNHIRNIDIGLAPLERNLFNAARSSIKAVEYGQWGVPAVLPNYVTYTREFTHNKTSLMYNNPREFLECIEELINNDELRNKLGTASRDFVRDNKLESLHSEKRYTLYKDLIDSKRKVYRFQGVENATT